ncbi:MAG TPA: hypothetical protein VN706_13840 [Gemmatimonadaceae bacterium]|nr:hypothetical protein [Gemmatimonadaceae bacterium]
MSESGVASHASDARVTALLTACVALGALIGVALALAAFGRVPTELRRVTVIMHAMRSPGVPPTIAVGNSVVMNGIDARLLGTTPAGRPAAWNFATTGQLVSESLVIADALPAEVHRVVLGITIDELTHGAPVVPLNKYLAFLLSGYRPSQELSSLVARDTALDAMLHTPEWRGALQSRWVFRSVADFYLRSVLRRDLDFERAQSDLYHPAPFTRPVRGDALTHLLQLDAARHATFAPSSAILRQILDMNALLRARGKQFTVVIMPEHPLRLRSATATYLDELRTWIASAPALGLDVLDLHDRLGASDFVDDVHPSASGSRIVTRALAAALSPISVAAP